MSNIFRCTSVDLLEYNNDFICNYNSKSFFFAHYTYISNNLVQLSMIRNFTNSGTKRTHTPYIVKSISFLQ